MNKLRLLGLAGLLAAIAAIALAGGDARAQILIGQTAGLTGPAAASVNETVTGADLWIDAVNAQGGVNGEKIQLIRIDDGFDVDRTVGNARHLIEDRRVLALFMTRGTPHTQALLPLLARHDLALVAPSTGAMALHQPVIRQVFNVRATYQREAEKAITHLRTTGASRIAVVHAADSFGSDALEGAMSGFRRSGGSPTLTLAADREKPDYATLVPRIVAAGAQAVLWIGSGSAVVEGVKALRAAGSQAQVVTLSNNASAAFIQQLGVQSRGVIVTQVFPNEHSMSVPMVKEAMTLARARGLQSLSPATLEGFASAKVLVEGLRRAGRQPTRARLIAALDGLRDFDLGGLEVSYSPQDHTGIDHADLSIISDGRFRR